MRCLNWKVVAALVAAGVALWMAVPGTAAAALPLLVLLACPLSMLVMMRAMGSGGSSNADTKAGGEGSETAGSEIAALRAQVDALRAERGTGRDAGAPSGERRS